jgi:hypothetical protein
MKVEGKIRDKIQVIEDRRKSPMSDTSAFCRFASTNVGREEGGEGGKKKERNSLKKIQLCKIHQLF